VSSDNATQAMNQMSALEKVNEMINLNSQKEDDIMLSELNLKKEILTNDLKELLKNVGVKLFALAA
jgi:hypothetical protein|tara:strand:- start:299 stop:496 length:198 start_codon:yes stop_codon:yes gene_type:complete